jgi:ATP-dependent helicase STH1/SNF2
VIRNPHHTTPELERLLSSSDPTARIVDSAIKVQKSTESTGIDPAPGTGSAESVSTAAGTSPTKTALKVEDGDTDAPELPKGPFLEDKTDSGIYPYNAYVHPFSHFKSLGDPKLLHTRLQRLIVPSVMPGGLDPHQIIIERNRYVDARIQQRIAELEAMPATMGDGGFENISSSVEGPESNHLVKIAPQGKLNAMIELRSLRVLEKQRALRAAVAERLTHGTNLPLNRVEFRRVRKPTVRDARQTETLERKQRADRERQAKQRHVAQLNVICAHGREIIQVNRHAQDRIARLNKSVLTFHTQAEKEEQKRIERLTKERLKALKADDEETYMKLIDTTKDTRITQLLRQTDNYLESLAQAVRAQQNDGRETYDFDQEEGPPSEATFGASSSLDDGEKDKVDYYAVAHRIREKVTKQPAILVGGTLKEYQVKGLQWMVSLYNNKLNGILADEMVFTFRRRHCLLLTLLPLGFGKDHPNYIPHRLPDRIQASARALPHHRSFNHHDQLAGRVCQVGSSRKNDRVQG